MEDPLIRKNRRFDEREYQDEKKQFVRAEQEFPTEP